MAPGKRTICCCGSSSCCQAIGWIDIFLSLLGLVSFFGYILVPTVVEYFQPHPEGSTIITATHIFLLLASLLSLTMGIVLLIGTSQKRAGFLETYKIVQIVILVLTISLTREAVDKVTRDYRDIQSIQELLIDLVGIGWTVFAILIFSIRKDEVNVGVFRTFNPVTRSIV